MTPLTVDFSKAFARKWISAWNAHDLEAVLSLYSENTTIESPIAARILPESGSRVEGKEALRAYWTLGLKLNPHLKFRFIDLLVGSTGVSIYYENVATGKKGVEVFVFDATGLVKDSLAFHQV